MIHFTYWKFSLVIAFVWAAHFAITNPKKAIEAIFVFAAVYVAWPVLVLILTFTYIAKSLHRDMNNKYKEDVKEIRKYYEN